MIDLSVEIPSHMWKTLRKDHKMTQTEAAKVVDVHWRTWQDWELGQAPGKAIYYYMFKHIMER